MRLLMDEPNVLLLDEPTNDLDIDTLTALEDLLDGWPGTLVVVCHDRYFVERVCDNVYALMGDGGVRHLPGGIDQYVELRAAAADAAAGRRGSTEACRPRQAAAAGPPARRSQRLERALEKLDGARGDAARGRWPRRRPTTAACASCTPTSTALGAEREALEAAWIRAPSSWRPERREAGGPLPARASGRDGRQRLVGVGQPADALVDLLRGDARVGQAQGVLAALQQEVGALDERDAALAGRVNSAATSVPSGSSTHMK